MREVNAMKRLDHVHIVKYFGNEIKDGNQGPGMYIIYYMHDSEWSVGVCVYILAQQR